MPENGNWTQPHNQYTLSQKEVDSYMGLYYFGSRHYDPYTGSWISQDSYRGESTNPMSLHRYMYNYNSPVNYVDWYGYAPWGDVDITPQWMDNGISYVGDQINKLDAQRFAKQRIAEKEYGLSISLIDQILYGDPGQPIPGACTTYELQYSYYYNFAYKQGVADDASMFGTSIFLEPVDYVSTGYRWANNDFSYWDLAMVLPLVPGSTGRFVSKIDEGGVLASKLDNILGKGDDVGEVSQATYRLSKSSTYRKDFIELLGFEGKSLPIGFDIDHMIPVQIAEKNPVGTMEALEILGKSDINDSSLLQGIELSTNRGVLRDEWSGFINNNPDASGQEIVDFYNQMSIKYPGIRLE